MDFIIRLIADYLVVVIVAIGAFSMLVLVRKDRYQQYARALMAGLTAYVVGRLFSLLYVQTDRPFVTEGVEPKAAYLNNPGFPSDHALFVTTIALVVWGVTRRSKLSLTLAVFAILVCIGRVVALVHSPVDVIGGVAAAVIGVGLWYPLFRRRINN